MKISIGLKLRQGPWGGGNQFATSLTNYLSKKGIEVVHDLSERDIDIILLAEPRKTSRSSAFTDSEVLDYLRYVHPDALVVHRINECDERKGTDSVNSLLVGANNCADHTVFISSWLKDLFSARGIASERSSVILNGGDKKIFNAEGFSPWNHHESLKIVTHHWGDNWLKGFDIYRQLDDMLERAEWKERIRFTYIGRIPEDCSFRNTQQIKPLSGTALASELRNHHLYVTASRNEPAGMHHIEGAMCGMPLLYIESGALPEYCRGFGISFIPETFTSTLEKMMETYEHWLSEMSRYPHTADKMCTAYHDLFLDMIARKKEILAARKKQPKPSPSETALFKMTMLQKQLRSFRKNILKGKKSQ